jgi:predicted ATPase
MTTESHPRLAIAITGAQGVGKTTLAAALKMEFDRLGIKPCLAHHNLGATAATKGVPLGGNANSNSILEFSRLHIKRERQMAGGIHLLDRCFVDVLAYGRQICADQPLLLDLVEELARASLARIDLVVRIPIIPSLSESKSKNESSEFRFKIENAIATILDAMPVRRLDVVSTTPEDRVNEVLNALSRHSLLAGFPH